MLKSTMSVRLLPCSPRLRVAERSHVTLIVQLKLAEAAGGGRNMPAEAQRARKPCSPRLAGSWTQRRADDDPEAKRCAETG